MRQTRTQTFKVSPYRGRRRDDASDDRRTGSYGFAGRYPDINRMKRKTIF